MPGSRLILAVLLAALAETMPSVPRSSTDRTKPLSAFTIPTVTDASQLKGNEKEVYEDLRSTTTMTTNPSKRSVEDSPSFAQSGPANSGTDEKNRTAGARPETSVLSDKERMDSTNNNIFDSSDSLSDNSTVEGTKVGSSSVKDTTPAKNDTDERSGEKTTSVSAFSNTSPSTYSTTYLRNDGGDGKNNNTSAVADDNTKMSSATPSAPTSNRNASFPTRETTTFFYTTRSIMAASGKNNVTDRTVTTETSSTTGVTRKNTTSVTDNSTNGVTNNKTTSVANNSTITDITNTSNQGCPHICICPDYEAVATGLLPGIRRLLGERAHMFTDEVIKLFLIEHLVSEGENPKSILFQLLRQFVQSSNTNTPRKAIVLSNAMEGTTLCDIPANFTFVLDAAAEARLFPQVAFKAAFLRSLGKTLNISDFYADPQPGELGPTQLYNISFLCKEGSRVVIAQDAKLYRYGRWSDSCNVTTEGVLVMDRNMSLIRLRTVGGTADWLHNIMLHDKPGTHEGQVSFNASSSDVIAKNMTGDLGSSQGPTLSTRTIFPRIREVRLWNMSLSVAELSEVLGLFQKASTLDLTNSSMEDFNCSQLLPTAASWTNFTLSNTGLTSLPACLLRPSLVSLELPGNAISDLTPLQYPRFVPPSKMDLLDLSDNDITDVGVLTDMNLLMLMLAGNRISSLNKLSFVRLTTLAYLDLSRNRLQHLEPGTFKSLVNLQQLRLQHNYLQHFDSSVRPLRDLIAVLPCKIYLNDNRLSHPPFRDDGYDPGVGMTVFAASNPYGCDCDMENYAASTINVSLEGSYGDKAEMSCHYPLTLRGRSLDTVSFNDTCPVVTNCPQGCTCTYLRGRQEMTVSGKDSVTTLSADDQAAAWPRINTVTVDCSSVTEFQQPKSLPGGFPLHVAFQGSKGVNESSLSLLDTDYLLRVVSLNLSRRGITRVPEFLCETLPKAEVLDLSFNKLTSLPDCFHSRAKTLPTLELRLAGNPWSCDCDAVSMRSWLAELRKGGELEGGATVSDAGGVIVSDVEEVWCSASSKAGVRVAEWDTSVCEPPDYLPWVLSLSVVLGLAVLVGPLLYAYRLKAMVVIHAHLHVRPFTHVHHFREDDYDHEALVVHGASDACVQWVVHSLLLRTRPTHHRLCVPERDFMPGASVAESYATAVTRSKATVCLLSPDTVKDEWWLYAFQLARAKHARCPHAKLLLVWMEEVEEGEVPEEVRSFLKTNTYLSVEDAWFWKKLFFYLPDPPKTLA